MTTHRDEGGISLEGTCRAIARRHGMKDLTTDLRHVLDPVELRRRVEAGVAKLPSYIPGGVANIRHSWPTDSRMQLEVVNFGPVIPATVDLMSERVRVTLRLPVMLSLMAGPIEAVVRKSGGQLLID
ncbi:MAG TPA: polyhydroxyalkanoic acid system family protein [Sphingobium sp.]|uniref:polyhydroxyalkanoic acid system family protein n=1 Tax=Sphingobium sp. TaxID=1912891 RepID=UPI002ED40A29